MRRDVELRSEGLRRRGWLCAPAIDRRGRSGGRVIIAGDVDRLAAPLLMIVSDRDPALPIEIARAAEPKRP